MKKSTIILSNIIILSIFCLCTSSLAAVEKITELKAHISTLEKQRTQLEAQKQSLIAEGDELSQKIESLKIQSRGGLGIIGRYRLSRGLRKAQNLSEKTQAIEKKIHNIGIEIGSRKSELEEEYEKEIAALLDKVNGISKAGEKRHILEKVREYREAKEKLVEQEKRGPESLDIAEIEIEEYDGPQEIREKADLINDFANKLNGGMRMVNARIERLKEEIKTRRRLGEFAEEISFFGERVSRAEIASGTEAVDDQKTLGTPDEGKTLVTADTPRELDSASDSNVTEKTPVTEPSKIVMERNGVSADFVGISLDQIGKEIELLEKRKNDLKKQIEVISEKADSFYRKADEIEKSEIKTGEKKR